MKQYDLNYVLDLIKSDDRIVTINDKPVRVSGVRLNTFAQKGTTCICCLREGSYFRLEFRGNKHPHFNLYTGDGILMTRDHIICKSNGGPDTVENMNPMCAKCNTARGTRDLEEFLSEYEFKELGDSVKVSMCTADKDPFEEMSIPVEELEELVRTHVDKYGLDSNLTPIWKQYRIQKRHQRLSILNVCNESEDELGASIISCLVSSSKTLRKKIGVLGRNYGMSKGLSLPSTVDSIIPETARRVKVSKLCTAMRRHLDNPTEESEDKLRNMISDVQTVFCGEEL